MLKTAVKVSRAAKRRAEKQKQEQQREEELQKAKHDLLFTSPRLQVVLQSGFFSRFFINKKPKKKM